MKSPADLAGARRRRSAQNLRAAIAAARAEMHQSLDRLFDAAEAAAQSLTVALVTPEATEPRLVGTAVAAKYLNISPDTLRAMVAKQQIDCIPLPSPNGSRPMIRFDLDVLDRYRQSRTQSA